MPDFVAIILSPEAAPMISAWATVASAVVSVALVIVTVWLAKLTQILAHETTRAREIQELADVRCAIEPSEESIDILQVVVANIGRAVARDVVIQVSADGHLLQSLSPGVLLPDARLRISIGSALNLLKNTVRAEVSFRDSHGNHRSETSHAINGWENYSRGVDPALDRIAHSLSRLEEQVRQWRTGIRGRLEVSVFDRRDRDREHAERAEMLRQLDENEAAQSSTVSSTSSLPSPNSDPPSE